MSPQETADPICPECKTYFKDKHKIINELDESMKEPFYDYLKSIIGNQVYDIIMNLQYVCKHENLLDGTEDENTNGIKMVNSKFECATVNLLTMVGHYVNPKIRHEADRKLEIITENALGNLVECVK
jgi:hypothetical protein